eukprot:364623-Chlamydomonas_euryale.AAC.3
MPGPRAAHQQRRPPSACAAQPRFAALSYMGDDQDAEPCSLMLSHVLQHGSVPCPVVCCVLRGSLRWLIGPPVMLADWAGLSMLGGGIVYPTCCMEGWHLHTTAVCTRSCG